MIYLARHGQTDWNKLKIFNGSTETELNETGIEQAETVRIKLVDVNFEACFSSPQKRAVQASRIIHQGFLITDDRLSEIICGEFEGKEETRESFEAFLNASRSGKLGVESFDNFMKRNIEFCEMLEMKYSKKNILIVTHAANARIINYYFTGKPKGYDFSKAVSCSGGIVELNI